MPFVITAPPKFKLEGDFSVWNRTLSVLVDITTPFFFIDVAHGIIDEDKQRFYTLTDIGAFGIDFNGNVIEQTTATDYNPGARRFLAGQYYSIGGKYYLAPASYADADFLYFHIFKDGVKVQTIDERPNYYTSGEPDSFRGISASGKYIVIFGPDNTTPKKPRLTIYTGT